MCGRRVPRNEVVVYYRATERLEGRCSATMTAFCEQNACEADDGSARSTCATMLISGNSKFSDKGERAGSGPDVPLRFVFDLF